MAKRSYQPPDGFMTMGQAQARLGVSKVTLARMARDAQIDLYEDPRDGRVRLLRVEDVERLAQPVKRAPDLAGRANARAG
jgi:hypothetical protein